MRLTAEPDAGLVAGEVLSALPAKQEQTTIQDALRQGRLQLKLLDEPTLSARLLLMAVLNLEHSALIARSERLLTDDEQQQYFRLLERAARHEPLPYVLGRAPFMGRDFLVTPDVLIPRPETGLLVETASRWLATRPGATIADVGTGSGCIAITLALAFPAAQLVAVDISSAALKIARANAAIFGVEKTLRFCQSHLLQPLATKVDLIVANLPYVAADEWSMLAKSISLYEPQLALRGGADGLDLISELLQQSENRINPDGLILLEIGWKQGDRAVQLAEDTFPEAEVSLRRDFAGHNRLISIELNRHTSTAWLE